MSDGLEIRRVIGNITHCDILTFGFGGIVYLALLIVRVRLCRYGAGHIICLFSFVNNRLCRQHTKFKTPPIMDGYSNGILQ